MLTSVNSARMDYRRQRTIKREGVALGPMTLKFVTIAVLALLTLVYLIQSTKGSAKNIQMTDLEQKKRSIAEPKRRFGTGSGTIKIVESAKEFSKRF